jgi:ABC-type transport system involved in multi-copper enzyme maturation permease subunit
MSPAVEIRLVMSRELRRSFRSAKGALLALIALAGGGGVSMLFAWMDRMKRENLPAGLDIKDAQEPLFEASYGAVTGKALAACPYSLWMMLIATLWLGPLLISLLDYDAVSGEVQHRSVRFWTVRTRRSSYILGKVLGAWLTVLAVTLAMNVIVWAVIVSVGEIPLGQVLGWGVRFFAVTMPISAAWCGVAMLVGSLFRTPMLSLLAISAAFSGLWIVRVVAGVSQAEWLAYAYPNFYDALLLSPRPADVALGLLGTGAIAALTTGAAAALFETRDV